MKFSGKYYIITYATHKQGRFDELVNNPFQKDVIVLGMGKKWNGFMDKPIAVFKYIQELNENDIVVVLDGFDTIIKRDPDLAINKFVQMNIQHVLVSKENYMFMGKYFQQRFFGVCEKNNNLIANAGMLMGYVKHLKQLYQKMINYHFENPNLKGDDMRILNKICQYDLYTIDASENIFANVVGNIFAKADSLSVEKASFVSFPARSDQGIIEKFNRFHEQSDVYVKVLWKEFLITFVLVILCAVVMKILIQRVYAYFKLTKYNK